VFFTTAYSRVLTDAVAQLLELGDRQTAVLGQQNGVESSKFFVSSATDASFCAMVTP
jgi:hypothetical protein